MRNVAVAIIGLAALSQALPVGDDATALEKRQYQIGEPSTTFTPGNAPSEKAPDGIWIVPAHPEEEEAPSTDFKIGRRGRDYRNYHWTPDAHLSDKQNIVKAELELQELQNDLRDCDISDPKRALIERAIRHLKKYLDEKADITNISAPPGTTTTFTPGKRSIDEAIIARLVPSSKYKRQQPGDDFLLGQCTVQKVIEYVNGYLAITQGVSPRPGDSNYWAALPYVLRLQYCGIPTPGWETFIKPGSTIPGGPIVPDPTRPGGPIVPDPTRPGSPIVPNPGQPGSPIVPDPSRPGAPIVPQPGTPGAPITPDKPKEGAPLTPSS
jgi:hypothetical protein